VQLIHDSPKLLSTGAIVVVAEIHSTGEHWHSAYLKVMYCASNGIRGYLIPGHIEVKL
jgi:hypothetical protein